MMNEQDRRQTLEIMLKTIIDDFSRLPEKQQKEIVSRVGNRLIGLVDDLGARFVNGLASALEELQQSTSEAEMVQEGHEDALQGGGV